MIEETPATRMALAISLTDQVNAMFNKGYKPFFDGRPIDYPITIEGTQFLQRTSPNCRNILFDFNEEWDMGAWTSHADIRAVFASYKFYQEVPLGCRSDSMVD